MKVDISRLDPSLQNYLNVNVGSRHVGHILKEWSEGKKWTKEVFAKKLYCTVEEVEGLLDGTIKITKPYAVKIAYAFNTSWELWFRMQKAHNKRVKENNANSVKSPKAGLSGHPHL